jgi:hypothetical protein
MGNAFASVGSALPPRRDHLQASSTLTAPLGRSTLGDSIIVPEARDRLQELVKRIQLPTEVNSTLDGSLDGDLRFQLLLFHAMIDTWPRLQKALREVKLAARNAPWTVTAWSRRGEKPSEQSEALAKEVENSIWSMRPDMARGHKGFEGTVEELAMSYFLGHGVMETHWKLEREWTNVGGSTDFLVPRWSPKCTKAVPGRYFGYPNWEAGEDRLMLDPSGGDAGAGNFIDFPAHRFLVAVNGGHPGHPTIAAPLRALTGFWMAAVYGLKWMMQYAQIFGIPFRWAEYPTGDTKAKGELSTMLSQIGSQGWAAFPAGAKINFLDNSKGGSSLVQRELLTMADEQVDVFVLGQTLTSSQGEKGSQSLGTVHMEVRQELLKGVCDFVGEVLTHQLSPSIVALNHGPGRKDTPGIWAKFEEPKDEKGMVERDKALGITSGKIAVSEQWFYDRHGIPLPSEGERLLQVAPDPAKLPPTVPPEPGKPKPPGITEKTPSAKITATDAGDWRRFDATTGTLGLPRAEMPQIRSGNRAAMVGYLRARGIESVSETILPARLKPTQREWSPAKVDAARSFPGGNRAILISEDNHIIDGHHQWKQCLDDRPKVPIRVIRLMAPAGTVLSKVKAMPSVTFDAVSGRKIAAGGFRTLDDGQVIYIHNLKSKSDRDDESDQYRDGPASKREAEDEAADRDTKDAAGREKEPSAEDLREPEEGDDVNELEQARKEYEAEMLEESMSGFPEIGKTAKGRLPRPDDLSDDEPLKGEVQRIWERFKKETARRDGKGRKVISPAGAADYFAPKGTRVDLDVLRQQFNTKGFDYETPAQMLEAVFESLEGRKSWGTTSDGFGIAASLHDDLDDGLDAKAAGLFKRMEEAIAKGSIIDQDAIAELMGAAWINSAKGSEE